MSCPYLTSKTEIVSTKNDAESLETSKEVSMPVCKLCRKLDTDSWAARCRNTTPDGPCYVWVEQYGQTPDPKFQTTLTAIKVLPVEIPGVNLNRVRTAS